MTCLKKTMCSSLGLKLIMGSTGLMLVVFLLIHVLGNLLILVDPGAFNEYAHALTKNKAFLYTAEVGLLTVFVVHILTAIRLTIQNRKARPIGYKVKKSSGLSRRNWFSSNMMITGGFLIYFIVTHLLEFRFGEEVMTTEDGVVMRDMAATVIQEFSKTGEVIFYVIAMLILGGHLLHGLRSAFASLGAEYPRLERPLKCFSRLFVLIVCGGFIAIPLVIYFGGAH